MFCEKCHWATGPHSKKALSAALLAVAEKLLRLWPRSVFNVNSQGAFAHAVGKAEQLLFALRRRADDDQDALLGAFKTGLRSLRPSLWYQCLHSDIVPNLHSLRKYFRKGGWRKAFSRLRSLHGALL